MRRRTIQPDDGKQDTVGAEAPQDAPAKREPETYQWRDQTAYRCPFCAMDSLDEAAVIEHIAEKHPIPPPPITAVAPVEPVPTTPAEIVQNDPPANVPDDPDVPKQESTGTGPEIGADDAPKEV